MIVPLCYSCCSGNGGYCVEAAPACSGLVPVRDSKDPEGPDFLLLSSAW
ncbi:DUF397 domain-containing protein [Kitasatospora sp. NPDC059408]